MNKNSSYEKIAYGITNEMIKRAVSTAPEPTEEELRYRAYKYFNNMYYGSSPQVQKGYLIDGYPVEDPNLAIPQNYIRFFRDWQNDMRARLSVGNLTAVPEGNNFSNRPFTPGPTVLNSNREPYNTFETPWLRNPLTPKQKPIDPAVAQNLQQWGSLSPTAVKTYSPFVNNAYGKGDPKSVSEWNGVPQAQRSQAIRHKVEADRKAKAESMQYNGGYTNGVANDHPAYEQAVNNWDNTYAAVESTIRTPSQVQRWKARGFSDEQIDAYVKRETTKAMERRYGKRPVAPTPQSAPVAQAQSASPQGVLPPVDGTAHFIPQGIFTEVNLTPVEENPAYTSNVGANTSWGEPTAVGYALLNRGYNSTGSRGIDYRNPELETTTDTPSVVATPPETTKLPELEIPDNVSVPEYVGPLADAPKDNNNDNDNDKAASANIINSLFPIRPEDIIKEYF